MEGLTKKEKKELKRLEIEQKLQKASIKRVYKKILFWIIGLLAVGLVIWGVSSAVSSSKNQPTDSEILKITSNDIATGSATTKANLIEYADFECPACATYSRYIELLKDEFPNDLRVAYRFFPLPQHKLISSQVAYAAYKQGKFWEMYLLLYDNQRTWVNSSGPEAIFDDYAKKLNLNLDKFRNDRDSDSTKKFINDQLDQGIKLGVNATPTFYLNGNKIEPAGYEEFKSLIEAEIKK